ncbi:MAG: alanine--tRNA ligase, partial [Bacteroidales bacterium]|nr:alanine--tRNA ligase [Bacteroidales bacterium]
INGINFIAQKVDIDMNSVKDLSFRLNKEVDNMVLLLGIQNEGKANLSLMVSESLVKEKDLNAGSMIREIAKEIQGGGGGQAHFATAGGKNPGGFEKAFSVAKKLIS